MWSYITGERGGPIARSVYDVCVVLDAIAGFDSFDLWTAQSLGQMPYKPYVSFIDKGGLRGARVGVLKEAWDYKPAFPDVIELAKKAIAVFSTNGAKVIDPISIGLDLPKILSEGGGSPSRYERIAAINHYLARQARTIRSKTRASCCSVMLVSQVARPTKPRSRADRFEP